MAAAASVHCRKALTEGEAGQAGDTVEVELGHDVVAMCFHGADADVEECGDLAGGLALGEQLEDFAFPRGKPGQPR